MVSKVNKNAITAIGSMLIFISVIAFIIINTDKSIWAFYYREQYLPYIFICGITGFVIIVVGLALPSDKSDIIRKERTSYFIPKKFCPNCGKKLIEEEGKFCSGCGFRLPY